MEFKYVAIILLIALLVHPYFTADETLKLPFIWKCLITPCFAFIDLLAMYLPRVSPIQSYQIDYYCINYLVKAVPLLLAPYADTDLFYELENNVESKKIYSSETFSITLFSSAPVHYHSTALSPFAIFIHGGGFLIGSSEMYSPVTKYMALKSGRPIASIDYRLAVEHLYPSAIDDCIEATRWMLSHAKEFGLDADDVVLVGDSAGGNLVLGVAIKFGQIEKKSIFKQVIPIYPVLSMHNLRSDSYTTYRNDPPGFLKRSLMYRYFSHYIAGNDSLVPFFYDHSHLSRETQSHFRCDSSTDPTCINIACGGSECRSDKETAVTKLFDKLLRDPYLCPIALTAEHAQYLPPVNLAICRADVLRDESLVFEQILRKYNIKVSLKMFNCYHVQFSSFLLKDYSSEITNYVVDLM